MQHEFNVYLYLHKYSGEFAGVEQKGPPWLGASITSLLSKEWISPHLALQFSHSF